MSPGSGGGRRLVVQPTPVEKKQRKRFTAKQKPAILREWEATGNGVSVAEKRGIHAMTLYRWRKRPDQGAAEFLKGSRPKADPRMRELERENEKLRDTVALLSRELMALKKKDELGLTGRTPGRRYSLEQRRRIVETVERLREEGVTITASLRRPAFPRSTFCHWKGQTEKRGGKTPPNSLLPCEEEKITALKMREPHLSHRQISGLLRTEDVRVSPSRC